MLRLLHQMRVDLPLAGSVLASTRSIDVRAFEPGADDDAWLSVNNRAFRWHPDQGGWDRARLTARLAPSRGVPPTGSSSTTEPTATSTGSAGPV